MTIIPTGNYRATRLKQLWKADQGPPYGNCGHPAQAPFAGTRQTRKSRHWAGFDLNH